MCVLIFSTNFVWNISCSKNNLAIGQDGRYGTIVSLTKYMENISLFHKVA